MFYVRNIRNRETDCGKKMQSYFHCTSYQAEYITGVAATVILNG